MDLESLYDDVRVRFGLTARLRLEELRVRREAFENPPTPESRARDTVPLSSADFIVPAARASRGRS